MNISLEKIAKMAGVSKTTVSLVINGRGAEYRISEATQEKILKLVKEYRFSPNQYARGLRLKKTRTLGLVVPDLINWFFSQIVNDCEKIAREYGYQIFITCSDDDEDKENEVVQNLISRNVEGLIVASVMKKEILPVKFSNKIPTVYIDRKLEADHVSCVTSDNVQGAYDLANYMCLQGLSDIYYIGGLEGISTMRDRLRGYKRALKDNDIPFNNKIVFHGDNSQASGYRSAGKIFAGNNGLPRAIFTASYTLLEGLLQCVKETWGSIPAHLHIGTFDDHPLLDYLPNKMPSVQQDYHGIASSAIEIILKALAGEKTIENKVVPPKLIIRS